METTAFRFYGMFAAEVPQEKVDELREDLEGQFEDWFKRYHEGPSGIKLHLNSVEIDPL